jgi:hypothetical protein
LLVLPSVVIHDLDVFRSCSRPSEAQAPLVIDPDAVLTGPIAPQYLKTIPWRGPQELQCGRRIQQRELPDCNPRDRVKAPGFT